MLRPCNYRAEKRIRNRARSFSIPSQEERVSLNILRLVGIFYRIEAQADESRPRPGVYPRLDCNFEAVGTVIALHQAVPLELTRNYPVESQVISEARTGDGEPALTPEQFSEAFGRGYPMTRRFLLSRGASSDTAEEVQEHPEKPSAFRAETGRPDGIIKSSMAGNGRHRCQTCPDRM
jgi:hypothetical protein